MHAVSQEYGASLAVTLLNMLECTLDFGLNACSSEQTVAGHL